VASDQPLASQVGASLLARGGSAADAVVGAALVLGVVRPFASGLGGGGFCLVHDPAEGTRAFDFRETAPAGLTQAHFETGSSTLGGLAVGTPAEAFGWEAVHATMGVLAWQDIVRPAEVLAYQGFPVDTLVPARLVGVDRETTHPGIWEPWWHAEEARWLRAGEIARRPALGRALALLRTEGAETFRRGEVARDLVETVQRHGGVLSLADLADYRVVERVAVRQSVGEWTVVGMPPPASGGVLVPLALRAVLARWEPGGPLPWHVLLVAWGQGFALRAHELGDPMDSAWDHEAWQSDALLARVLTLADRGPAPGTTDWAPRIAVVDDGGTSHLAAVDREGRAVACTTTVNLLFGSQLAGDRTHVVLNNQMDDFATRAGVPNAFGLVGGEANRVRAGARPLSSMSPTLVLDGDGQVVGAVGGSGGPQIVTGVSSVLLHLLTGVSPGDAVAAPRLHFQWQPAQVFHEPGAPMEGLEARGWSLQERAFGSAIQAIWRGDGGWLAASDPRKHGAPAGVDAEGRVRLPGPGEPGSEEDFE
jgi:gamma-glutamyltranspeptidase/glutathione hydrolase